MSMSHPNQKSFIMFVLKIYCLTPVRQCEDRDEKSNSRDENETALRGLLTVKHEKEKPNRDDTHHRSPLSTKKY